MKVHELLPGRASIVHQKYLAMMEKECGYGLGKVPQLEDVSNFLKSEMEFTPKKREGMLTLKLISQGILDSLCDLQPDFSLLATFLLLLPSAFSRWCSLSQKQTEFLVPFKKQI